MSTFTHHDDGTSEERWAAAFAARDDELAAITPAELAELGHLVVVAAHPDDETLGAAGLLARCYAAGVRTTVIVATSGEASHPDSPTHRPDDLARMRERETVAAVASIDPGATVTFLGIPDGGIDEPAHRRRLSEAILAAVEGSLPEAAPPPETAARAETTPQSETAPQPGAGSGAGPAAPVAETWIASPWSGDRHPDHAAASDAVADAVGELRQGAPGQRLRRLEYPVWLWHWATPESSEVPWDRFVVLRLDEATAEAKHAALALHVSQIAPLGDRPGDEVLLAPAVLEHFGRPFEVFVQVEPSAAAPADGAGAAAGAEAGAAATAEAAEPSARYFDALHASSDDPWGFESRWYEERKRAILLATLPDQEYREVLEVGTSTGVLSRELALRASGRFVGVDVSEVAVQQAAERNRDLPQAVFERMTVPVEWPVGAFDLIVVSEVGYYLDSDGLIALLDRIEQTLAPEGVVLFCHWRHRIAALELAGDDVHAMLERRPGFVRLARHLEEDFVLDVVVRPPAVSVATREGIA